MNRIISSITILAVAVVLTSISSGNAIGQNTTSLFSNDTETLQEFEQLEGNNTQILDNDTNISNPGNDVEDSLSINENESY
jgi:hypothetical protein